MVRYRPVVKDEKLKRLAEGHPDFSDSLRRVVQRLQEMPAATLQADRMDVTNGNVGQPLAAVTQGVHDLDVSGFVVERALRDLAKQSHSLVLIFEEVLACLAKGRGTGRSECRFGFRLPPRYGGAKCWAFSRVVNSRFSALCPSNLATYFLRSFR